MAVSNSFQITSYVLDNVLVMFRNNMGITKNAYRDFQEDFTKQRFSTGQTVNYRLEERYSVGTGESATSQDVVQKSRALTLDIRHNIQVEFNGKELTLDPVRDKPLLESRMSSQIHTLAGAVELAMARKAADSFYYTIGNPNVALSDQTQINKGRGFLSKVGVPLASNLGAMNVDDSVNIANGLSNYFNKDVNNQALMKGFVGNLTGFGNLFESVYIEDHIAGLGAGTGASGGFIDGGAASAEVLTGSVIPMDGLATTSSGNVFTKGDIIEVSDGSCFFVNPVSKQVTNIPAQFIVTADVPDDGSGAANVPVSPEIIPTGTTQNLSAGIADGTTFRLYDSHKVNFLYHPKAVVFAAPMLHELEGGVIVSSKYDEPSGIGMVASTGASIREYLNITRVDLLAGGTINPEYGMRLVSKRD